VCSSDLSYLYRPLVWGLYVAHDDAAKAGRLGDPVQLGEAMVRSRLALGALADLKQEGLWLLGDQLTLADIYLAPMLAYGCVTAEGRALLAEARRLQDWWGHMTARPSVSATRFAAERT
jgi:glutathione S-transferase